jgi:Tfp pilus assembly protein PilW
MAYFIISNGLRGCYMADSSFVIEAQARRKLKAVLESEARDIRDAGFVGLSNVAIASLAAEAWRKRKSRQVYPIVAPYRRADQPNNWAFGLQVSSATRAEYLEYLEYLAE